MEQLIPIEKDAWRRIHGTWQMRIDSHNRLYWDCEAGIISNALQSQVTVDALPEEQFRNQDSPQPICDALDKPFEFVQSRRLAHSGQ